MLLEEQARQGCILADGMGRAGAGRRCYAPGSAICRPLGLARRVRGGVVLDADLAGKLRVLADRRDVIRTLNQRRLEGAAIEELGAVAFTGQVVRTAYHDELGSRGYMFVRDTSGVEHYGTLRLASRCPKWDGKQRCRLGKRGGA